MKKNIYTGLITALITPFKDGKIDIKALDALIERQISAGVSGLVVGGSTGEGSSISASDYHELIKLSVQIANGRINIIAGFAGAATEYFVQQMQKAEAQGVQGLMCTVPYYVRPEQNGLVEHFKILHDSSNLPLIVYIQPKRTGSDLSDETILKLAENERIVAIKDCSGEMQRPLRLATKLPEGFNMLTGNDDQWLIHSAHGGRGCIAVISNILPAQFIELQNHLAKGDYDQARLCQTKLLRVYEAMYLESNPIGIKCASHLMGLCTREIKMPLTPARPETESAIKKALQELGVL